MGINYIMLSAYYPCHLRPTCTLHRQIFQSCIYNSLLAPIITVMREANRSRHLPFFPGLSSKTSSSIFSPNLIGLNSSTSSTSSSSSSMISPLLRPCTLPLLLPPSLEREDTCAWPKLSIGPLKTLRFLLAKIGKPGLGGGRSENAAPPSSLSLSGPCARTRRILDGKDDEVGAAGRTLTEECGLRSLK